MAKNHKRRATQKRRLASASSGSIKHEKRKRIKRERQEHVAAQGVIARLMVPRFGRPITVPPTVQVWREKEKKKVESEALKLARAFISQQERVDQARAFLRPLATPLYDQEVLPASQRTNLTFFRREGV